MRICEGPKCANDLDALGLRADARCCSRACAAEKSRAKRGKLRVPDDVERFRAGFAQLAAAGHVDLRQRSRELRQPPQRGE